MEKITLEVIYERQYFFASHLTAPLGQNSILQLQVLKKAKKLKGFYGD